MALNAIPFRAPSRALPPPPAPRFVALSRPNAKKMACHTLADRSYKANMNPLEQVCLKNTAEVMRPLREQQNGPGQPVKGRIDRGFMGSTLVNIRASRERMGDPVQKRARIMAPLRQFNR